MGWQVALILDQETEVDRFLSQMPVWAVSTKLAGTLPKNFGLLGVRYGTQSLL